MTHVCSREDCGKPVDLDDSDTIVQMSFTEEHKVWCDTDCFRKDKSK